VSIGYYLYFYMRKNFRMSALFGGHLISMWLLTPLLKSLFFLFIIFVHECHSDFACAYVSYAFSSR
jgi:hypothetical protein